jgi:hypothetical protein
MTQKNINFGGFPNDPNADSLRSAFQKIEQNFTELYATDITNVVHTVTANNGISSSGSTDVILELQVSSDANNNTELRVDGIYSKPASWENTSW